MSISEIALSEREIQSRPCAVSNCALSWDSAKIETKRSQAPVRSRSALSLRSSSALAWSLVRTMLLLKPCSRAASPPASLIWPNKRPRSMPRPSAALLSALRCDSVSPSQAFDSRSMNWVRSRARASCSANSGLIRCASSKRAPVPRRVCSISADSLPRPAAIFSALRPDVGAGDLERLDLRDRQPDLLAKVADAPGLVRELVGAFRKLEQAGHRDPDGGTSGQSSRTQRRQKCSDRSERFRRSRCPCAQVPHDLRDGAHGFGYRLSGGVDLPQCRIAVAAKLLQRLADCLLVLHRKADGDIADIDAHGSVHFLFHRFRLCPPGRDEEPFRDQQETSGKVDVEPAWHRSQGLPVYRARRCGRSFRRASRHPTERSHRRPRGLPPCGAQTRLRGSARPRRSGRGRRARRWHGTGRSMWGSRPAIGRGGQSVSLGLLHVNAGVHDRHHSGADRRIAEQERDRGRLRRTQRLAILSDDPVPPGLAGHDQINLRQPDRRGHEAIPVLEPVDVEVFAEDDRRESPPPRFRRRCRRVRARPRRAPRRDRIALPAVPRSMRCRQDRPGVASTYLIAALPPQMV